MSLTFRGKLAVIGDITKVSDKFTKRTFVLIDEDSKFKDPIEFQLTQDKVNLINNCSVGDILQVEFNLKGRGWNSPQGETKYFVSLEVWKVTAESAIYTDIKDTITSAAEQAVAIKASKKAAIQPNEEFNDLPF